MTDEEMADRLLKALAEQAREDLGHEASVVQAEQTAGITIEFAQRRRIVEMLAQRGTLVVVEWDRGNDAVVHLTARSLVAAGL